MISRIVRIGSFLAAFAAIVSVANAGGWSHQLWSSNGSTADYTNSSVYIGPGTYAQQMAYVYNAETTTVNSGPLGLLIASASNTPQTATGTLGGNTTVSVYQAVVRGANMLASGLSVTVFTW